MTEPYEYDLIILGAGPAGLTAGVYAARKQLNCLMICHSVGGQAMWSSGIENYPGYIFISGVELVQKFQEHLERYNVVVKYSWITKLSVGPGGYVVSTKDAGDFRAKCVIIATGKSPRRLNVPGETKFAGKGVTYCATCDGPMYEGLDVAVVGGGNSGLDAVMQLMKICPKVYLIETASDLRCDSIVRKRAEEAPNVEIVLNAKVKEIVGEDFVKGIILEDAATGEVRELPVEGVFVEVGLRPNVDFLGELIRLNENREIIVECTTKTELPGLFAAGDVTSVPDKQIIIAAGDGAKAALGAYSFLVRSPEVVDWGQSAPRRSEYWDVTPSVTRLRGTDELLGVVRPPKYP